MLCCQVFRVYCFLVLLVAWFFEIKGSDCKIKCGSDLLVFIVTARMALASAARASVTVGNVGHGGDWYKMTLLSDFF